MAKEYLGKEALVKIRDWAKTGLDKKQDTLTAGEGIAIDSENVICSTVKVNELTYPEIVEIVGE